MGPPLPSTVANNKVLNVLDSQHLDARSVDTALYMLDDYGLTADINHYRSSMTEYEALLARQSILDRDFYIWRAKSMTLCKHLYAVQARSRLHPYLSGQERLPAPPGYLGPWNMAATAPPTLSIDEALAIDAAGSDEEEQHGSTRGLELLTDLEKAHTVAVPTAAKVVTLTCSAPPPMLVVIQPLAVSSLHITVTSGIAAPLPIAT
jgi:hypothetical protein